MYFSGFGMAFLFIILLIFGVMNWVMPFLITGAVLVALLMYYFASDDNGKV